VKKLSYYIKLCRRHKHYLGRRQGLRFAWSHKAFWNGCEGGDEPYTHIGGGRRS